MKKSDLKNLELSSDSLLTKDLLDSFISFLEYNFPKKYQECLNHLDDNEVIIIDSDNPKQIELNEWFLNEVLFDALNDIAPANYYFGCHPGDGSLFGFWKNEDI